MKSFIALCSLAALLCVLIGSIEAKPELRQKRAVSQEMCKSTLTPEQCKAYAEDKRKKSGECMRADVSGLHIEWADCGSTLCGDNTKLKKGDLAKPYPECCDTCEAIDPSKPAVWSQIG